ARAFPEPRPPVRGRPARGLDRDRPPPSLAWRGPGSSRRAPRQPRCRRPLRPQARVPPLRARESWHPVRSTASRVRARSARRAAEWLFDVARNCGMSFAPRWPRDDGGRDLPYEHVLERELRIAGQLARRVAAHEIACLEDCERLVEVVESTRRLNDSAPERL